MRLTIAVSLLIAALTSEAASHYVTQSGAGSANGTSLGNAWSVASFNASGTPAAGDTVYFSGTISSSISPGSSGSEGNNITLNCAAATLTNSTPITLTTRNYITIDGGTVSGDVGAVSGATNTHTGITVKNMSITGTPSGGCSVIASGKWIDLLLEGNTVENGIILWSDKSTNTGWTIRNNFCRSPAANATDQIDLISYGDAANVTIEGNYLLQRTDGHASVRHNDIIQCYRNGGGDAAYPTGLVIRYNWLELDVAGGSGDNSWLMLENMDDGGSPACKIYGNVFVGVAGTAGNNGMSPNSNQATATFYFYHNTMIAPSGHPGNTSRFLSPGILYARNNIGYDNAGGGGTYISWTMTEGGGASGFDYNFFYNWGTQTNAAGSNGSSTTNPTFTDAGSNDFSLGAASTLRGAADETIGAEYNTGISYGATWPNPALVTRSDWDVGAYEFLTASITPARTRRDASRGSPPGLP